jgi:hypothetical protein
MAFLMLKGFHPSNNTNQRRIWEAEEAAKHETERNKESMKQYQEEQMKMENKRLAGASAKETTLDFMYALPPGLKEKQEQEVAEEARQQQLDNIPGLGEGQQKFLDMVKNAPREGAYVNVSEVNVRPFGVDPSTVRAAQRANEKLARGQMAGEANPFVSHRSGAMDNLKLKNQEWDVTGDYVVDDQPDDEAALLASLSKKDRKLLAKYTKKLLKTEGGGDASAAQGVSKKHKKEKKSKHKKEKHKREKKSKHKKRGRSSSSS